MKQAGRCTGAGREAGAAMELNGKLCCKLSRQPVRKLSAQPVSQPKVRARARLSRSRSQLVDRPMSVSGTGRRIWSGQVDYC